MLNKFGYHHKDEMTSYERETLNQSEGRLRHASWHFPISLFAPALMTLKPTPKPKTQSFDGKIFKNPLRFNMKHRSAIQRMHRAQKIMYPDLYEYRDGKTLLRASDVAQTARNIDAEGIYPTLLGTVEVDIASDNDSEDEDESSPAYRQILENITASMTGITPAEGPFENDEEMQAEFESGSTVDNDEERVVNQGDDTTTGDGGSSGKNKASDDADEEYSEHGLFSDYGDTGDLGAYEHFDEMQVDDEGVGANDMVIEGGDGDGNSHTVSSSSSERYVLYSN
jgi:hypothetical protein